MRVLFDTNILLDAILGREPFTADAAFLIRAVGADQIRGFVSATTLTDIYYLVRRQTRSAETAMNAVTDILDIMEICAVDRAVLEQAILLNQGDFEDAVQVACAIQFGLDAIVTRDVAGFANSPIVVMSPADLKDAVF